MEVTMSRRRTKPQQPNDSTAQDPHNQRVLIEIGCTGRGTHKRSVIGSFYVRGNLVNPGTLMASNKDIHNFTDGEDYAFVKPKRAPEAFINFGTTLHKTYPFKCRHCDRDLPQGQVRLWRLLRILKSHEKTFLDLSALDAIG